MEILDRALHVLWTVRLQRRIVRVGASHAQAKSDQGFGFDHETYQGGVFGIPSFLAESADDFVLQFFWELKETGPASSDWRPHIAYMQLPAASCLGRLLRRRGVVKSWNLSLPPSEQRHQSWTEGTPLLRSVPVLGAG